MEKFTKLNEKLRKIDINIINSTEKIYFAYIIGWQENGLTLTATNQTIGDDLGMTKDGIKTLNNKCNKFFDFFSTIQVGIQTVNDKTSSSHIIKIDIDLFEKFLDNPIKPIRSKKEAPKKTSNEVELKSEVIIPEIKKEVKLKIKNKMEKKELKTEIKEKTFMDEFYESENDEQIIDNVIEEPIQELTSLVELQYDEMITLAVIESDDILTEIFKEDIKLSFDMIRMIAKDNELNEQTKELLLEIFKGIISTQKKYINKYQQFGGTKIKNELIN